MASPFKVVIVGAGLGGLSCAIACRREGLDVLILEKAPAITAVGGSGLSMKYNVLIDATRSVLASRFRLMEAKSCKAMGFYICLNSRRSS